MERQEPVIDSAQMLQDRVKLTWREIRDLASADQKAETAAQQSNTPSAGNASADAPLTEPALLQPSAPSEPARVEPSLSAEDRAAIIAYLSPRLEETLRSALRDALEMALANAFTRVRSDVERSIGTLVSQTVAKELESVDLSKILKR